MWKANPSLLERHKPTTELRFAKPSKQSRQPRWGAGQIHLPDLQSNQPSSTSRERLWLNGRQENSQKLPRSPARPKQKQNPPSLTVQLKFQGDLLTERNIGPRAAHFIMESNTSRLQFPPGLSHSWAKIRFNAVAERPGRVRVTASVTVGDWQVPLGHILTVYQRGNSDVQLWVLVLE